MYKDIPEIKIGEVFSVDGKFYMITIPKNSTDETNAHGQIVFLISPTA